MDLDSLRAFVAVCDLGTISAAADVVHRSQGAVSRRIAQLEREVGAPLFDRVPTGVRPTAAGMALRPHAEAALAAVGDGLDAIADVTGGGAGPVTLAIVGTLADAWLTEVLRHFALDHPAAEIRIRTANSAEVNQLVRRGDAALGVGYEPSADAGVTSEPLFESRLVVACAADHRLAGAVLADLAELHHELRGERWFAFPSGGRESSARRIEALMVTTGVAAPAIDYIDSLTVQLRLIESGFGLAVIEQESVAASIAAGRAAVVELPAEARAEAAWRTDVYLAQRRGGYLTPATKDLALALRVARGHVRAETGAG